MKRDDEKFHRYNCHKLVIHEEFEPIVDLVLDTLQQWRFVFHFEIQMKRVRVQFIGEEKKKIFTTFVINFLMIDDFYYYFD